MSNQNIRRVVSVLGVAGLCAAVIAVPPNPAPPISSGPDVVVSGIGSSSGSSPFGDSAGTGVSNNGAVGSVVGYSVGTISCNIGNANAIWLQPSANHPVIGTQIYRYRTVNGAGQFDQIGINWLKHGFCAADASNCTQLTNPVGTLASNGSCDWLGRFATDTYSASLNGQQSNLGPRSEVNPWTGAYPYPYVLQAGATGNSIFKRTQVNTSSFIAGSNYMVEVVYICTDEPAANRYNNYSYRQASVSGTTISLSNSTEAMRPAVVGWKEKYDNAVTIVNIDPSGVSDGRLVLGYKVTQVNATTWHYEYNLLNMNNHNSVRSFSLPMDSNVVLSNVQFRDTDYHSGEPYSLTDWTFTNGGGAATWNTQTFAQNANANALRWSTMYSFRFDANVAPTSGNLTLGMFRDGTNVAVTNIQVPSVPPPPVPGSFNLATPVDGATVGGLTPTLTWDPASNTDSYSVIVATDPGLSNVVDSGSVPGTSYVVNSGVLSYNNTYYWGVTATNAFGSTGSSPARQSFLTPVPPCAGDMNNDGSTNTADLALFLGIFGSSVTPGAPGDLNGDGDINTADLALFLGSFGCGA